jgi:hypothetical protein
MSFRDQLLGLIAEDKKKDAEKVLDSLDETLDGYATDIRTLKGDLRAKDGIKPEDYTRLEKENTDLAAKLKENEKLLKTTSTERDTLQSALESEKGATSRLLIDNGLTEALAEIGVKDPAKMALAKSYLREQGIFSIESEADQRKAIAVLKKDGKDVKLALKDYIKTEFSTLEVAKQVIEADASSGAGAQGGAGKGGAGKTMLEAEFNKLDPKSQAAFMKDGGTLK